MPPHNHFRHQLYVSDVPASAYQLLQPGPQPAVDTDAYCERMKIVAETWQRADVRLVLLVHGTLAGTDALGWFGEIDRVIPGIGDRLRQQTKRLVDLLSQDQGNYVESFRSRFERYLNEGMNRPTEVRLFSWSSQNHHLARAEAALQLIDTLMLCQLPTGSRAMIWGHSHAGNVMALATNLLAAELPQRQEFFAATEPYEQSLKPGPTRDMWTRTKQLLLGSPTNPLEPLNLDLVTFGTPVRYGWDSLAYSSLIHFVNHSPQASCAEHVAKFPQNVEEIRAAIGGIYGDYFQQTFIAGTNLPPPITNWSAWRAERLLGRLLQRNQSGLDLLASWRVGRRVADDGMTLLVDYANADPEAAHMVGGHAIYTRSDWLLFHLEEITGQIFTQT